MLVPAVGQRSSQELGPQKWGGQDETGGEHCQGSGGFFSRPYRKIQKKSRRA